MDGLNDEMSVHQTRELRSGDGQLVFRLEPLAGGRTGIEMPPRKWSFNRAQLVCLRDQIEARLEELEK